MKETNKKNRSKKLRKLVLLLVLTTIILTVSTYAWFIGMKTVEVDKFDIKIATTEGLELSMDGYNWSYDLNDIKTIPAYTGNANQWLDAKDEKGNPTQGLIPMSTVGDVDATASRMKLYEKGSLTSAPGGARLLTSRVNNYTNKVDGGTEYIEGDGYIAFDLFIRNTSGVAYYKDNQPLNEEAVYLTTNSAVKVATSGVQNTGIENSVRVGLIQLGRVESYEAADATEAKKVTDITCADNEETGVTGICRSAQIWEPNDRAHVDNALKYYKETCLLRTAKDVNASASYTTACPDLEKEEGENAPYKYYPTYAISNEIKVVTDEGKEDYGVNIYDGKEYNGYTTSTANYLTVTGEDGTEIKGYKDTADKSGFQLVNFPYFTDTDKNITGTARPQFMTLAPNSITKVRVYVWIEGQDIDNYDFASLGRQISVNFGFTKEQLVSSKDSTTPEFDYDGEDIVTR